MIDTKLVFFINKKLSSPLLDIVMLKVSAFGTHEIACIIGITLLIIPHKRSRMAGIAVLAGLALTLLSVSTLKAYFHRIRPYMAFPQINCLERAWGYSFPSHHTAVAFMVSSVIAFYVKNAAATLCLMGVAFVVGFSRIYLGCHYPTDIIAGAAVGSVLGLGMAYAVRQLCDRRP